MQALNTSITFISPAQTTYRQITPLSGMLYVGNKGIEFLGDHGASNFIQIPWQEIQTVRVQVFKCLSFTYIRGFYIDTLTAGTFQFHVKDNKGFISTLRDYLPREKLLAAKSLWRSLLKKLHRR